MIFATIKLKKVFNLGKILISIKKKLSDKFTTMNISL